MKDKDKLISIILVNFNSEKFISNCLDSIYKQTYKNYEVILVDNYSFDTSLSLIKSKFPWVKIVSLKKNVGFAEGNNIGIKYAKGDYFLTLNTDATLDSKLLEKLFACLDKSDDMGVVVPKIYLFDKKRLDSCGARYNNIGNAYGIGYKEIDHGQYDHQKYVPAVTACCMLVKKQVLEKTYLFDRRYFMYFEELDFSIRMRRSGYNIGFCKDAMAYHKVSQSILQITNKPVIFKRLHSEKNRLHILVTYYPLAKLVKNLLLITLSYWYWGSIFAIKANILIFLRYNYLLVSSGLSGIIDRKRLKPAISNDWVEDIEDMKLKELFNWARYYYEKS